MKYRKKFGLCFLLFTVLVLCSACKHEKTKQQEKQPPKQQTAAQKKLTEAGKKAYAMISKWGKEYFNSPKLGKNGKTCATCHPDGEGIKGAFYTYPKYSKKHKRVIQLPNMVNSCLMDALKGKKELSFDSTKMISILTYISELKDAGTAMPGDDFAKAELAKAVKKGEAIFHDNKLGSNGRVCADCHEAGEKIKGKAYTFPKYLGMADRVVTLGHMVNYCLYGPLKGKKDILMDTEKMTNIIAYIASFSKK